MRKIYLAVAAMAAISSASFAQRDLKAVLVSPESGANVSASASVQFSFNVVNEGPDPINSGDTLWLAYFVGDNIFSLSGVAGQASGLIIPDNLTVAAGQTIPFSAFSQAPISVNLATITAATEVCPFVVGVNEAISSATGDPNDPVLTNNFDCFNVNPSGASIEENSILDVVVFPNPANDVLNISSTEAIESVKIYGFDGKLVSTQTSNVVNVADLNAGMYIYMVKTISGKSVKGNFSKN